MAQEIATSPVEREKRPGFSSDATAAQRSSRAERATTRLCVLRLGRNLATLPAGMKRMRLRVVICAFLAAVIAAGGIASASAMGTMTVHVVAGQQHVSGMDDCAQEPRDCASDLRSDCSPPCVTALAILPPSTASFSGLDSETVWAPLPLADSRRSAPDPDPPRT